MSADLPLVIAARLPEHPTWFELLMFALSGALVVFLSLAALALLSTLIGYVLRVVVPRPVAGRSAASGEGDISDELVAVIAAAVEAVIGEPHRIVHIRGLTPEDLNWSLEGRLQHHASHKPQHPRH